MKIVAVLVVLPVRVVWDLMVGAARAVHRHLLGPLYTYVLGPVLRALGQVVSFLLRLLFVWPWVGLWRYLLGPLVRALYGYLIAPVARAVYRYLLRPPALAVWRYLLVPLGHGLAWLCVRLYRYVLRPVGKVLAWAWAVSARVVRVLGRGLRWVGWVLLGWPLSQVYRYVLTPVGHLLRGVWRTARAAVREARAEVRRMLFGTPPGEPARSRARTLSSTTAADAAPVAEFSPPR
ncbi:hypothetical protein ABZ934_10120 [Streptomyces sp. NPDC046557]|uniref:hypothetical protein n=1 Tax=Streptomyces sp. NPDC046557 TaxID=3155372 RepID=UPI0033F4F464